MPIGPGPTLISLGAGSQLWPHPPTAHHGDLLAGALAGTLPPTHLLVESDGLNASQMVARGTILVGPGSVILNWTAFFQPFVTLARKVIGPAAIDEAALRAATVHLEGIIERRGSVIDPAGGAAPGASAVLREAWSGRDPLLASSWLATQEMRLLRRHQAETDMATLTLRGIVAPKGS